MNTTFSELTFIQGVDANSEAVVDFWRRNDISLSGTDTPSQVARAAAVNPSLFIVAQRKEEIIGTVWGTFDGRRGYIVHLAVKHSDRGTGIGRALMEKVEERFRAIGCRKVHLFVEEHNRQVADFYRQLHWQERTDLTIFSKPLD